MIDYLIAGMGTLITVVFSYALGDNVLGEDLYSKPIMWALLKLGLGLILLTFIVGIAAAIIGIFITIHSNL